MHSQSSLKDFLRSFVANWIRLLAECDHRVRLRRKQSRSRCQQLVFPFFAVAGSDFHGHRRAKSFTWKKQKKGCRTDRLYSPPPPHSFPAGSPGFAPLGAELVPQKASPILAAR